MCAAVLHPLVLMNISDHATRLASHDASSFAAFGLLLGIQNARQVELHHSFELASMCKMSDDGNGNALREQQLDAAFLSVRMEQYKKVFPQYEVVGWYRTSELATTTAAATTTTTTHPSVLASCKEMHSWLADHVGIESGDSFLMLLFNPAEMMDPAPLRPGQLAKDLPLAVYEESFSAQHAGDTAGGFVQIPHVYASEASEHVAMDHVTHRTTTSTEQAGGAEQLQYLSSALNAVTVLQRLIHVVRNYVQDVHEQRTPIDRDIMRRIASVCACVRMLKSQTLDHGLEREHVDGSIKTLMAATTKALVDMSDLVDHYAVIASKHQKRGI